VLFVVGDDVGYSDFGYFNDYKTITPTVDNLLATGIHLADYCESSKVPHACISRRRFWRCCLWSLATCAMSSPELVVFDLPADTFKICSPSRAAMMTGPPPALA
jgi:hypothetical protein